MVQIINSSLAILAVSALVAAAPQQLARQAAPSDLSLTAQLTLADLATDRYKLLPNDAQFVFDFNKDGPVANRKTFPALVGSGSALAAAQLGRNIVPVHIHPRATELLTILSGRVTNYMIPEAGLTNSNNTQRVIQTELTANMMTINPQAAFHTIYNTDCEPASAVASFNSEDMGANQIANSFFSYNDEIIANELSQALSGGQIDAVRQAIATRTIAIQECVKKCNITTSH